MARNKAPPSIKREGHRPSRDTQVTATEQDSPSRANKNGLQAPQRIPKMKVDFSAVADSFEPRKAGEVQGTLIKHEINPASASSGQPTLKLEWSEDESPNRRIFRTYSLQPKALWSVKRDLIRMGADVAEMNSPEADLDTICESLYGVSSTLVFGDPRPGKDKDGNDRLYDNMTEVRKPD